MATPVDLFLATDDALPAPIEGVQVSIFDPDNQLQLAAQGLSDAQGRAGFVLPGAVPGKAYEVRVFKLGFAFGGQKRIAVEEPPSTTNAFDITGTPQILPTATDPAMCRCTGRFMDLTNKPMADVAVFVSQKAEAGFQTPKVLGGNMVAAQKHRAFTDSQGRVSFDLIRTGEYYVTFGGEDDKVWNIKVPDRASVNLVDLIHPVPVSLTWDDDISSVSMVVGDQLTVPVSVLFSDFEIFTEGLSQWIRFDTSDSAVAVVALSQDKAVITAVGVGTCSVSARCSDQPMVPSHVPAPSLSSPPLSVIVT
jgi:hypothetical protein